jgi:hypothetical protein
VAVAVVVAVHLVWMLEQVAMVVQALLSLDT